MAEWAVSGSVLVRFQSEYSRLEVVDRIRRKLTSLAEVELPDSEVLSALRETDARTVSISGFERHAVRDRLHPLFLEMNIQRERIGGLDKLLIWWATPEIADQIAARIPDFESWFLYRLELSEDLSQKGFDDPSKFGDNWRPNLDAAVLLFDERMGRARREECQPAAAAERERYTLQLLKLLSQIEDRRERESRLDRLVAWSGSPKTVEAMIALSKAFRGVERLQDAEALIRGAYAQTGVAGERADVCLELGVVLMELERLDDAEAILDRAVRLGRDSTGLGDAQIEALRRLAWLQQGNGKSAEALGSLREASRMLEAHGQSVQALLVQESLGKQLMSLGRSAEAVPILLAAAKAAGRSDKAIQFRVTLMAATALRNQGRYREALAVMDDGPALSADRPFLAMVGLELAADILTVVGEPSKALERAKAAGSLLLEQDPEWIDENWKYCVSELRTIAVAEWRCGFPADALVAIRQADTLLQRHKAELNSIAENVAILYRMAAEIQLESGALEDAMEWIRRAPPTVSEFQSAFSCAVRARVLRASGLNDEAVEWLSRAHKALENISHPSVRNHAKAGVYAHLSFTVDGTEAISWAAQSLEAYQWLTAESPERWRTQVAEAYMLLARRMQDAGMKEDAATKYLECLAFLKDVQSEFALKLRTQIESALNAA